MIDIIKEKLSKLNLSPEQTQQVIEKLQGLNLTSLKDIGSAQEIVTGALAHFGVGQDKINDLLNNLTDQLNPLNGSPLQQAQTAVTDAVQNTVQSVGDKLGVENVSQQGSGIVDKVKDFLGNIFKK